VYWFHSSGYKCMLHAFKCIYSISCVATVWPKTVVVANGVNLILCMGKTRTYRIFFQLYAERPLEDKFLIGRILELILGINLFN
jgi:hypothetical protein